MRNISFRTSAVTLSALLALLPIVKADEITELRNQLRALEQKLLVLERKQEIKDEDTAAAAKVAPKVTINDKGFALSSADGANSIKLRGLVQLDSRVFFNDGEIGRAHV